MTLPRFINTFFLFTVIVLAVLMGQLDVQLQVLLAALIAFGVSFFAFVFRWLTLNGMRSAIVLGTITYGLGGLNAAIILMLFFVTGSLFSLLNRKETPEDASRRDAHQVWANAFWFALFVCLAYLTKNERFTWVAYASIAAATADTWATEIGTYFKNGRHWLIVNGKSVPAGTDGAISIRGTLAVFLGSAFIAVLSVFMMDVYDLIPFIIITVAGIFGSFADSLLGAVFQYQKKSLRFKAFGKGHFYLDNNWVNALGTGTAALIALMLYPLLS